MAIPYEKIVAEDLNLGKGTTSVTMPGGGSATGNQINLATLLPHGTPANGDVPVYDATETDGAKWLSPSEALLADDTLIWGPASAATGDLITYDSTQTQNTGRIAAVAKGSALVSNGTGAAPVYQTKPHFDVRDYGAVGNGSTDDTAAIQAAIAALPSFGGVVYFPAGSYRLSAPIDINRDGVTLQGAGMAGATILYPDSGQDGIRVAQTAIARFFHLRDLRVYGYHSLTGSAVRLGTATYASLYGLIKNCYFDGFTGADGTGLYLGTAQEVTVRGTGIANCNRGVYHPNSGYVAAFEWTGLSKGISAITNWGILSEGAGGFHLRDMTIQACHAGAVNISGSEPDVRLDDVYFEGNGDTGTEVVNITGSAADHPARFRLVNSIFVSGGGQADTKLKVDYVSGGVVIGTPGLWAGTTPVITTANSDLTFVGNTHLASVSAVSGYAASLLGTITAIEKGTILASGKRIAAPTGVTGAGTDVAIPLTATTIEVTTDGDSDEDAFTLAAGLAGQTIEVVCKAVGNAADSFKITPATMLGGAKITFAANPIGKGCTFKYTSAGWAVIGNNGGTIA